MNEKDYRPAKGDKKNTIQYVHIGFVGIKCCGKAVVVDGGPHEP